MSPSFDSSDVIDAVRRDRERLTAVYASGLLDTDAGAVFDAILDLAARLTGAAAVFVTLVDAERDIRIASRESHQTLRTRRQTIDRTLCHFTIQQDAPLVISDTASDPRFCGIGTVQSDVVGAYLGVPLLIDGHAVGTLCAEDAHPREWTDEHVALLSELARSGQRALQLRRTRSNADVRYRALAEMLPVQVWTARPTGEIDFVSSQTSEYFGVPAEELLGNGWGQYVHPEDVPQTLARWSHALATGEPYQTEFRLRSAHGEYRWHLARAIAARDAHGAVESWVGSNTDVAGERAARAEAEAANRSKSEFLAAMSHELRTPLNAISGHVQLIEMGVHGPVTEAQVAALGRVQRNQQHLLGLINDVLSFAKLQAGRVEYYLEDVDLAAAVLDLAPMIESQLEAKRLGYSVNVAPDLVVRVDPDKLRQVLLNLLSNAVKFTEAGGRVAIDCIERPERTPGVVYLRVSDSGSGIAPHKQEAIFEPFVQVHDARGESERGTGLGLAISLDLARGMGGNVRVRSAEGRGSTFTLTLPIAVA